MLRNVSIAVSADWTSDWNPFTSKLVGSGVAAKARRELRVERVVGDVAVVGDGDHVAVDARELLLVGGLAVRLARVLIAADCP